MKFIALIAAAAAAQVQPIVAITDTTVLPMTRAERLTGQTVLVSGDRITAVGPSSSIKVPAGARMIDGRGKVLMPGLVDMHIHLAPVPGEGGDAAQRALAVMLAHGVTTARTMAGSPQNLVVRGKVESGSLAGPRIYVAAPALHEKNTPDPAKASAAVQKAKADGFDLIKAHVLPDPAVWQAVQREATRQGIPVAGHVANSVGLDRALAAGQQVEHLDSIPFALLPEGAPEKQLQFGQIPPPAVAAAVAEPALSKLVRKVAAAKSWHVPTLALFESILDVSVRTAELAAKPGMRFVPPATAKQWTAQREGLLQSGEFTGEGGQQIIALRRRIAGALHGAGVPLMAGSDTAQAFMVWGPGLYEEIRALAAAGLTPMEALKAATVVPRDYFRSLPNGGSALGWKAQFGTIEPGARADLILLDADPSRDLAALKRPQVVIAAGKVHDRAALDAMLDKAAADALAQ